AVLELRRLGHLGLRGALRRLRVLDHAPARGLRQGAHPPVRMTDDNAAIARAIIDANRYMTLSTADASGLPWVSPVWFATADHRRFFWVSDPNARHSRTLAARPELAIVIFDSTVAPGGAQPVYLSAL